MSPVEPFRIAVPETALEDLRERLRNTRFPEAETVPGWVQGVPLAEMRRLRDAWLGHDWRGCEARLNALGSARTVIDGCGIHFLHIRSPEPAARPLAMTHGWPGSVLEFLDTIGPLTDPAAHGGRAEDAFHLVLPSLPGYGFSDRPADAGWTIDRVAGAWVELMARLGYDRFLAQGGDWGAGVAMALGAAHAAHVIGIHLNISAAFPGPGDMADLTDVEREMVSAMARHRTVGRGYSEIQGTRPQTLGYALADSPVGQAAWIYEKYKEWSDCGDDPAGAFGMDRLLDTASLYWLTNTGASSGRMYWQNRTRDTRVTVPVPTAISLFPKEMFRSSRRFAGRLYPNLAYWNERERGGHFAAFEMPGPFVEEVRAGFRAIAQLANS
jgi:pimeloyl-ACP methyl ester carboxylesterase